MSVTLVAIAYIQTYLYTTIRITAKPTLDKAVSRILSPVVVIETEKEFNSTI